MNPQYTNVKVEGPSFPTKGQPVFCMLESKPFKPFVWVWNPAVVCFEACHDVLLGKFRNNDHVEYTRLILCGRLFKPI